MLGGFMGLAFLVGGPLTLVPGLVVWAWLLTRRHRLSAVAGGLAGFGTTWLLLIGWGAWACSNDPTCMTPGGALQWVAIGAAFLVSGVVLGLAARTRSFRM